VISAKLRGYGITTMSLAVLLSVEREPTLLLLLITSQLRGVGQDHMHYEVLKRYFCSQTTYKSHNNNCIIITDDCYVKGMTTTHCHHCKSKGVVIL